MSKLSGYILPANHYDSPRFLQESDDFTITFHTTGDWHFVVFKLPDARIFITEDVIIDTLETTGMDLCDNIDIDYPISVIEFTCHNGLFYYPSEMVAFNNQPKLF